MDTIFTTQSVGISDLREAPARIFEQANENAIVVLNHNRPAGYIVSNLMMENIYEQLADRAILLKAKSRLETISDSRRITLAEL